LVSVHAQRRLAAILAADVAGYTRLMEADEDATMKAWWAARTTIIDPTITEHGGRIVKHTGDGFLAEFPTATSAVECAAAMQVALANSNQDVEKSRRFDFRMGINVGDIVVDDEDIYGDGVNISARLESLAEPGSVCISAAVYEQVKNRLDLGYRDMGSKKIKHITDPIHFYQFSPGGQNAHVTGKHLFTIPQWFSIPRLITAFVILVALVGLWPVEQPNPAAQNNEPPVISLIPFRIIGEENAQTLFGEGLTEELQVALSSISGVRVINQARATDPAGTAVKKVQYRIEGSVRSVGNQVGVSARLIDTSTGFQLWAGRYDRKLVNVMGVQNEVAEKIVSTLAERLAESEEVRLAAAPTPTGAVRSIIYKGLTHIGRFAEMAAFLPQDLFNWVSGKRPSGLSADELGRGNVNLIAMANKPRWMVM